MKGPAVDWQRVAELLGAADEMAGCRFCKDRGTVPYIAEHILVTHSASPLARELTKAVFPEGAPRPPRPPARSAPPRGRGAAPSARPVRAGDPRRGSAPARGKPAGRGKAPARGKRGPGRRP